jgi:hypothetical protein
VEGVLVVRRRGTSAVLVVYLTKNHVRRLKSKRERLKLAANERARTEFGRVLDSAPELSTMPACLDPMAVDEAVRPELSGGIGTPARPADPKFCWP